MDLQTVIREVLKKSEGALACSLMGYDGIEVFTAVTPDAPLSLDIAALLVEYAELFKRLRDGAERLDTGTTGEFSLVTEKLFVVLRPVNDAYFAALFMRPDANFGMGRYRLRMAAPTLATLL